MRFDDSIFASPDSSTYLANYRWQRDLIQLLNEHDETILEDLRRQFDALPSLGEEAMALGRVLAGYEDQRGWYQPAENRYQSLLTRLETTHQEHHHFKAVILCDLAEFSHRWHVDSRALELLAELDLLLPELEDWALEVRCAVLKADIAADQRDTAWARKEARHALANAVQHNHWPSLAGALNALCYSSGVEKEYDEALSYSSRILAGDQVALNPRLLGEVNSNHGYFLRRLNGDEAALPFYEAAVAIHSQRRDPLKQAGALASLGIVYTRLSRPAEAEELYQKGISQLKALNALQHGVNLVNNLGTLQLEQGKFSEALNSFREALSYNRALGRLQQEAATCANIGNLYANISEPAQAADWLEQGAALYLRCGKSQEAARLLKFGSKVLHTADLRRSQALAERARQLENSEGLEPEQDNVPLEEALAELVTLLEAPEVTIPELQGAVRALVETGQESSRKNRNLALEKLAELISETSLGRAGFLALGAGALIEQGADPYLVYQPVLARLAESLEGAAAFFIACRNYAQGELACTTEETPQDAEVEYIKRFGQQVAEQRPEEAQAWSGFELLCRAAMAVMSRSAKIRKAARQNEEFVNRLAAFPLPDHSWIKWLTELLTVLDDEELVVLHPALGKGYRVRISGVADNFQLHTLLMGALIGDPEGGWLPGQRPNPLVLAAAIDQPVHPSAKSAVGAFNLVNWTALHPENLALDTSLSASDHWIWGEGRPADILPFEGNRIVLLGPPSYNRSWNADRHFAGLRGELEVIEFLSPQTVEEWFRRIALANRQV